MRTLQEMLEADRNRSKSPIMRFRDYCQYIYDPLMAIEDTNLSEEQKKALIIEISSRIKDNIDPSWPTNYKNRLLSARNLKVADQYSL